MHCFYYLFPQCMILGQYVRQTVLTILANVQQSSTDSDITYANTQCLYVISFCTSFTLTYIHA